MARKLTLIDPTGDMLKLVQNGSNPNIVLVATEGGDTTASITLTPDAIRDLIDFLTAPLEQAYTPAKAAAGRTERLYLSPPKGCATEGK